MWQVFFVNFSCQSTGSFFCRSYAACAVAGSRGLGDLGSLLGVSPIEIAIKFYFVASIF